MTIACPFCEIASGKEDQRIIDHNATAFAVRDGFPISKGHTLLIPKRHIPSFFDITDKERQDLLSLIDNSKQALQDSFSPDGYNIGINDGAAAGQTVQHLHIHLIPRYECDLPDPRGGIRWVIPEKADYWSSQE